MSTDEYVPSDARMREQYIWAHAREAEGAAEQSYGIQVYSEAWDAWLTAHDARVRRDAAREAWTDCVSEASALGHLGPIDAREMLARNPHEETGDEHD